MKLKFTRKEYEFLYNELDAKGKKQLLKYMRKIKRGLK